MANDESQYGIRINGGVNSGVRDVAKWREENDDMVNDGVAAVA